MSLNEETERIVISYSSVLDWFIRAAVVLCIGIVLFVVGNYFFRLLPYSENLEFLGYFAFLVLIAWYTILDGSFRWLIGNEVTAVNIDFASRHVDLTHSSLVGGRTERFHFHQVNKFSTYRPKRLLRVEYYLQMTLVNRKSTKFRIPIGRDKQKSIKLIKRINRLMKASHTTTT